MNPEHVISPQARWELYRVIYNHGPWSVAYGTWDGDEVIAVRWNGGDNDNGFPTSSRWPVWFILPDELRDAVEVGLRQMAGSNPPGNAHQT